MSTVTGTTGNYMLPCVPTRSATITARAEGFSTGIAHARAESGVAHVNMQLAVAAVQTDIQVGEDATATDTVHGTGTRTLGTREIQQLADDPDDFLRQLQALAVIGGGIPGSAIITVDGFQNMSALPPKGSIVTIRINPDMFSPEYERAPYLGGRVEIFTRPGADSFHGLSS